MPDKQAQDQFDGAAFLTVKVQALDSVLAGLRDRMKELESQRDHINDELNEIAKSISDADADRTSFQHTLAQLSGKGSKTRESIARTSVDNAPKGRASGEATLDGTTLADKIRALMLTNPRKEWAFKDLRTGIPNVNEKVLSNTILRMYKRGQLDRIRAGRYRVSSTQSD